LPRSSPSWRSRLFLLLVAPVAGAWLAALPYAENDPCMDDEVGKFAGGYSDTLSLWPPGTACQYETFTVLDAPSTLAVVLCALLVGALFASALHSRPAALRGAALAACVLAWIGFVSHLAGFNIVPLGLTLAWPFLVALDHRVTEEDARSWWRSTATATAVIPATLLTWMVVAFSGYEEQGIAAGILAGAAAAHLVRPVI
jgi:hypothetical protein